MISNVTLPRLGIPRTPIYPPLIAAAYVIGLYAASNVSVEALPRPLVVGIAVGALLQLILSAIQRNADRGAFVSLLVLFVLMGLGVLTLILGVWLAAAAYVAIRRGRGLQTMPWLRATRILQRCRRADSRARRGERGIRWRFQPLERPYECPSRDGCSRAAGRVSHHA